MAEQLKGENKITTFRQAAERLVSKIAPCEGVSGIIFVGGLVRGFADRFSDLDITVFLGEENEPLRRQIRNAALDEERGSGVEVDLEIHVLRDFGKREWGEVERFEFSRAEVVFDPTGEVARLFGKKLKVPGEFWVKRLVVCAEHLKWYCCPAREGVGTVAEAWVPGRSGCCSLLRELWC